MASSDPSSSALMPIPVPVHNWAGNQRSSALGLHRPSRYEELAALVERARARDEGIRAIGSLHSWSRVALVSPSPIHLVRLDQLDPAIEFDAEGRWVEAGAGLSLASLVEALDARGLTVPALGSIMAQSLGGLVGTGTHGSSLRWPSFSDSLQALEILTDEGETQRLEPEHPDFDAARLHLGRLGITTRVRLETEPAFDLEEHIETLPRAALPERSAGLAREHEYLKIWWLPHTEEAALFRYRRLPRDASWRAPRLTRWADERLINGLIFPALLRLGARLPRVVAPLNRVVSQTYLNAKRRRGPNHAMLTLAMPPRHRETEWAVPLERVGEAWRCLFDLIDRDHVRVNFPAELRFCPAERSWLSPAFGRDSAVLGVYIGPGPDAGSFLERAADALAELGARPHWGKESAMRYRHSHPRLAAFEQLRSRWDPRDRFGGSIL